MCMWTFSSLLHYDNKTRMGAGSSSPTVSLEETPWDCSHTTSPKILHSNWDLRGQRSQHFPLLQRPQSFPHPFRNKNFIFFFFLSLLFCLFFKTRENNLSTVNLFWVIFCVSHLQKIWLWSLIEICSLKTQSVNSDKCHCLSFSIRLKIFFLDHPETKLEAAVNWELTIWFPERRISEQCDTEALGMDQCLAYALLEDSILMLCGTHCIGAGWSFWKK